MAWLCARAARWSLRLARVFHVITGAALGGPGKAPANERVTLGHIGVGARGLSQAKWFGPESQSVAVCDPFRSRRERAAPRPSAAGPGRLPARPSS